MSLKSFSAGTYARLDSGGNVLTIITEALPFSAEETWFKPYVVDAQPAYNSATQKVVFAAHVIEANQVRKTWQVASLTTTELDTIADSSEDTQLLALWAAFQAGTETAAQRNRVLKRLFKQLLKNKGLI